MSKKLPLNAPGVRRSRTFILFLDQAKAIEHVRNSTVKGPGDAQGRRESLSDGSHGAPTSGNSWASAAFSRSSLHLVWIADETAPRLSMFDYQSRDAVCVRTTALRRLC